jgi:hypothetical protein
VVRFVVAIVRQSSLGKLLFIDIFESKEIRLVLILSVVKTTACAARCSKKLLPRDRRSVGRRGLASCAILPLFLQVFEFVK